MSYRHGHVQGTKREKPCSQDWYAPHAEAHAARIEAQEQQGYVLAMAKANLPYAAHERPDVRAALAAEVQSPNQPAAA